MRSQGFGALARQVSIAGRALWSALVFSIVVMGLSAWMPGSTQAQTYRFATVVVEGNRQIDAATIAGFARIATGRALTAGEVNAAYQRVVTTGFFRTVDFVPSGSRLVIRVQEYPLIGRVALEGNRRINDDTLRPLLRSREGGVYSPAQAEQDANALAELYAARGRLAAQINPRIIERPTGRVDLVFEITEGHVVEIQRLTFVGNTSFSDRRLRNALQSAQAGRLSTLFRVDNYDDARIARDRQVLQDFYRSRGFIDAVVTAGTTELTRERNAVFVTYTIREGRQYRFGRQVVTSELPGIDPAPYMAAMSSRGGTLFTPTALETLIRQVERVGYQAGERFLRADPRLTRNERDGVIDVELALVRGDRVFVERIDIQGNATTQDHVVRRQFQIAEGDPLNPREIREAAARIEALGYFSQVAVTPVAGSAPDQAVVDVQLQETTTGQLGFGLSYGVNDGLGGNINYSESNFLGRGQSLSLSISTLRAARSFDLTFSEPALLGRDLALGLRVGRSSSFASALSNFGSRVLQFSPSLTFPVSEFGRLTVRAAFQSDTITVAPLLPAPLLDPVAARLRADALLGTVTTGSIGFGYNLDTRGRGHDPDRGVILQFNTDMAGLGGNRRWMRSTLRAGYEQRVLNGDVLLRAEVEGGVVVHRSGASRINERFVLGPDTFRGFRPYGMGPVGFAPDGTRQGLGGNMYVVARFDAEFPLGLPQEYNMAGGVFLDVGTLRGIDGVPAGGLCVGGATIGCVTDSRSLRASAGVSLFWGSPIGPLRFNFATPLRRSVTDLPQRFDLTLATRF